VTSMTLRKVLMILLVAVILIVVLTYIIIIKPIQEQPSLMSWLKEGSYAVYITNTTVSILANASSSGWEFFKKGGYVEFQGKLIITWRLLSRSYEKALIQLNVTIFNISKVRCHNVSYCPRGVNVISSVKSFIVNLADMSFYDTNGSLLGTWSLFINPGMMLKKKMVPVIVYHGPCDGEVTCEYLSKLLLVAVDYAEVKEELKGLYQVCLSIAKTYGEDMKCAYLGMGGSVLAYDERGLLRWVLLGWRPAMFASDVLHQVIGVNIVSPVVDLVTGRFSPAILYLSETNVGQ